MSLKKGSGHSVQEKIPIVTEKYLDANSELPQNGIIACEICKDWIDKDGKRILTVSKEKPWGVETIQGLNKFDFFKEQLMELK